jgi:hypothetical protein
MQSLEHKKYVDYFKRIYGRWFRTSERLPYMNWYLEHHEGPFDYVDAYRILNWYWRDHSEVGKRNK